jgi:hypothetical protein
MPLNPELIEVVSHLKEEGLKGCEIAERLGLQRKEVTILSQGYVSEKAYLRDLRVWREKYTAIIKDNLGNLILLGWPIREMIVNRSVTIHFSDLFKNVEDRERDLKQSLKVNTKKMGLEGVAEEVYINYHNGIYYLRPQKVHSKAFLPPYANLVLKREVE